MSSATTSTYPNAKAHDLSPSKFLKAVGGRGRPPVRLDFRSNRIATR